MSGILKSEPSRKHPKHTQLIAPYVQAVQSQGVEEASGESINKFSGWERQGPSQTALAEH